MTKLKKILVNFFIYYLFNYFKFIHKESIDVLNKHPKISVFLPIFNKGKYLNSAIKSLQSQTLINIEIIAINDASTDDSLKILKKILKRDKRIKILNNDRNRGPLYSRAMGIINSSGEYLMNLDADDKLLNNNCLKILYNLAKSFNYDFCRFLIKRIPGNAKEKKEFNLLNKIQLHLDDLLITNKLVSRKILIDSYSFLKDRIHKSKWLLHDDNIWSLLINKYSKKSIVYNRFVYYYKRNNESLNLKRGSMAEIKSLVYKLDMNLKINLSMNQNDFKSSFNQIIKLYDVYSGKAPELEIKNNLKEILFKYIKFNKIK